MPQTMPPNDPFTCTAAGQPDVILSGQSQCRKKRQPTKLTAVTGATRVRWLWGWSGRTYWTWGSTPARTARKSQPKPLTGFWKPVTRKAKIQNRMGGASPPPTIRGVSEWLYEKKGKRGKKRRKKKREKRKEKSLVLWSIIQQSKQIFIPATGVNHAFLRLKIKKMRRGNIYLILRESVIACALLG